MLLHTIRMIDMWQCVFIIVLVLMKSVIKERNLFQEIIVACIVYYMQSHALLFFVGNST
jgi:hypothetical protein